MEWKTIKHERIVVADCGQPPIAGAILASERQQQTKKKQRGPYIACPGFDKMVLYQV